MVPEAVRDLIRFIVGYATQNDIRLTTLRLVKFLYLADLYYARKHRGKTLTGFPWAFIYFGPYCREAIEAIEGSVSQNIISMKGYESKFGDDKDYNLFFCYDDSAVNQSENKLPFEVSSQLKSAIKKYGDDTPYLLDHVYFETEPMKDARQGDILDFSKVDTHLIKEAITLKKIKKEKIELARNYAKALANKIEQNRMRLEQEKIESIRLKDDLYYQAIKIMDGEDLEIGLKGIANIEV